MEKYKKYTGVAVFAVLVVLLIFGLVSWIKPKVDTIQGLTLDIENQQSEYANVKKKLDTVKQRIKRIKESIVTAQKKVYSPIESNLGNETLFFTLYNDVVEMLHTNSIKIKSIDYAYNPTSDNFVSLGKDMYFVCDINIEAVSNYTNLGKLIQDIYQYPYYIRINSIEVKPYPRDKKILISNISLRLYAHTSPDEEDADAVNSKDSE